MRFFALGCGRARLSLIPAVSAGVGLAFLLGAREAPAQSGQGQPAPAVDPTGPVGPASLIDVLGIRPEYTTTIDVNKTAIRWDQNLNFGRDFGPTTVTNSWRIGIQDNSAQNNYTMRDGNTKARFEYRLPGQGAFSTGGNLDLKRNLSDSDVSRILRNGSSFDWFLAAGLPGKALSRLLSLDEGVLSWDVSGAVGLTENTDVRQNYTQLAGTNAFELSRSDSTKSEGRTRSGDSRLSITVGKAWKFDLSGKLSRTREDATTRQLEFDRLTHQPKVDTTLVVPAQNDNRRMALSTAWTPNQLTKVELTGTYLSTSDLSYSVAARGEDRSEGLDQALKLNLKFTPLWGINFDLTGEKSEAEILYNLNVNAGRARRRDAANGRVNFKLGGPFGFLRNTELTSEMRWEDADNTFQAQKDFRGRQLIVGQTIRRPLGTRLVLVTKGEGSLVQTFYEDRSQDRDDLRLLADAALGYRPNKRWDTRATFQVQNRKNVAISSRTSGNSNTVNSYQVGGEYSFQATPKVLVTQRCAISADYSFYNFYENRNALVRLTDVRSGVQARVGDHARVNLNHTWQMRDSGQYARPVGGGTRAYSRQLRENLQTLEVTTGYDFTEGFHLTARQRMDVRERRNLGSGLTTRDPVRLEFTGGMDLNHQFSPEFQVRAMLDRTQSSLEKNYWRISASATRKF